MNARQRRTARRRLTGLARALARCGVTMKQAAAACHIMATAGESLVNMLAHWRRHGLVRR